MPNQYYINIRTSVANKSAKPLNWSRKHVFHWEKKWLQSAAYAKNSQKSRRQGAKLGG